MGNKKNHNWTSDRIKIIIWKILLQPEEENNWNPFDEEFFQIVKSLSIVEKENF